MSISVASSAGFSSLAPAAQHRQGPRPGFPPPGADAPAGPRAQASPPGQQLSAALHEQLLRWQAEFTPPSRQAEFTPPSRQAEFTPPSRQP